MEASQGHYEFTAAENAEIESLAGKMRLVGWWQMVLGTLSAISGFATLRDGGFGSLVAGVVFFLFGLWILRAHGGFRQVVETEGADIAHLMTALGELKKLFTLYFYLIVVALVMIGVFLALAVIVMIAGTMGS